MFAEAKTSHRRSFLFRDVVYRPTNSCHENLNLSFSVIRCSRPLHKPLPVAWRAILFVRAVQHNTRAAQNSHAVTHVEYASVEMIRATIDALGSDLPPAAVKLGMMGTDAVVSVIGAFLDGYEGKVVCDPVMVSTRYGRRVCCRC